MMSASDPCSDHSYELPLRRNLLLLRDLLDVLRFVAGVLLDRIGVVSCQRGGVQLPRQTWGGEHADDDAAAERFLEATLRRVRISSPPVTTGGAARYRRRRAGGNRRGAEDGGEGAAVCAICLAGLEEAGAGCQEVAELGACSHAFHAACIDAWAGTGAAATCPLCRAPMSPTPWEDDGQSALAQHTQ
ncbi:probable E3 ubiquitin-protein ligase ATL44 [Panicum virgatum]|uniref:RING-type domain-containing protein n=1 Tax=Panicum virgatum TaxID=38727 RepID=A0A8T0QDG5_PANVG|nr:probable E3 ubiquitin-protein ligase ATL44 [Panicum virgatum]KAG2568274.1 hypothetical protein PVAP13_7NG306624 [Panicum virgatum]